MPTWWQCMHVLTGADYVHLENSADEIIRRVRYTAAGRPFCRYFGSRLIFLDAPDGWRITPLTTTATARR